MVPSSGAADDPAGLLIELHYLPCAWASKTSTPTGEVLTKRFQIGLGLLFVFRSGGRS